MRSNIPITARTRLYAHTQLYSRAPLGVSNVHPNENLGKQRVTYVSAVLLQVHYQDTAAGVDGDGGGGVGADDGETKTAQVTEEVICVLAATVAYIHDYTDDGDGIPLSLTCSNQQWKQI